MSDAEAKNLLIGWRGGDLRARDRLFEMVYQDLRVMSAALLRREGRISLSIGDLVNEASSRMIGIEGVDWQDKAHFMALAARMMRRVLIDHVRKKDSHKRQHQQVTLMTGIMGGPRAELDLAALEQALIRLEAIDAGRAEIVEMRYFGGMTLEEIAAVTGQSPSTIKRSWRASRAWLLVAIEEDRQMRA